MPPTPTTDPRPLPEIEHELAQGPEPEPPALEPEKDLRWSLRRPAVRYSVATLGLVSLLFSIASGFASWNPWSLLVVAIVCAVLAFPRFITENIKAIRFPGGGGLDFREPTEPLGAQSVEDLAERPAPSNLSDRRLLLAQLRTAGVGVRNRGILLEPADLSSWRAEVDRWSDATVAAVDYVNHADAEWLRTLDAVPPPRVQFRPISSGHEKAFRELDFRLVRLDALITRYGEWDRPENSSPPRSKRTR